VSVNVSGGTIAGDAVVCVGQTNSTLTSGLTGGTWSSSASAIANVHAINGLITGMAVGTANITYTSSPGCYITRVATVNPAVASISGPATVIAGNTVTLTNATGGGTWSSSNTLKATIVSGTGVLTGVASGTTSVTYRVSTGCYVVRTQTVTSSRPDVPVDVVGDATVFSVYPNPTKGTLTINAPVNGIFTIFTIDGKRVAAYALTTAAAAVTLPYDLAAGIYVCRFSGEDGSNELVRIVYEQ
jgi:uncharacterized protein YjdB